MTDGESAQLNHSSTEVWELLKYWRRPSSSQPSLSSVEFMELLKLHLGNATELVVAAPLNLWSY